MFKNFKRKSVKSRTIHNMRQEEQLGTSTKEHRVSFDKIMERQRKVDELMLEVYSCMITMILSMQHSPTRYEQEKNKLISCLTTVQKDEVLKQNVEVQKIVSDIYSNIDDQYAMLKIAYRFQTIAGAPQNPDILSSSI